MARFLLCVFAFFASPLLVLIPLHFAFSIGGLHPNEMMMFFGSSFCVYHYVVSYDAPSAKQVVSAILLCLALSCVTFCLHHYSPEHYRFPWFGPLAVVVFSGWMLLVHAVKSAYDKKRMTEVNGA